MRKSIMISGLSAMALIALMTMPSPVSAEMLNYKADLKASEEVPPTDSSGKGTADVTVDTDSKKVSWKVTQEGLTGNPTAAHFHGPADMGQNAGPVVDMTANINDGSADATDEQIKMIQDGKAYINIHTEKFPDGEIRGQVLKVE
jgi:hypothetical protein